jgi:hypothetical protein
MRKILLENFKNQIEDKLASYLKNEGIALVVAANDNFYDATTNCPHVILNNIENIILEGSELFIRNKDNIRYGAVPDNAIMCYLNGHAEESIK